MIDKILLAVDGSANAQRATDIAAELAAKLEAELMIVHVLMHGRPPEELVRMAEVEHLVKEAHEYVTPGITYVIGSHEKLLAGDPTDARSAQIISVMGEQIAQRASARCAEHGVRKIKTSVRAGDTAEEVLKGAADFGADMIVIGSRGLGLLRSSVLGSVSQKVLHHAQCSVVTVH